MYYVYVLKSIKFSKEFYTGFSRSVKRRIIYHNQGKSKHTNKFKPWKLVFYAGFNDRKIAMDFERYLKTDSGIAFRNKRLI